MARPPEKVVHDIGKQLAQKGRLSKDFIVESLRQAGKALTNLGQLLALEPLLRPLSKSLVDPRLLDHKDKDVRVLVAICFCEIMRVLAPDPFFDDKTYKDIFNLYISMFMELGATDSPSFTKRVKILETIDKLECCKQMLDIGCDELILKMFRTFFSVVCEQHTQSVINGMLSIMTLILKEEEISQELLVVILKNLKDPGEGIHPASYQLAVKLIKQCSDRIKPAVCKYLTCCILDRDDIQSELRGCYHQIILEIFKCAPDMLTAIIPSITQESMIDQVDARMKSLDLIGKLLTLPKIHYLPEHYQLLHALLSRLSDKLADVRISAIHNLKHCYMTNPLQPESNEILSSLGKRLLDFEARVRTVAVTVLCDLAQSRLKLFPPELLVLIIERLRDKAESVRKEALTKLFEVYRHYCTMCNEGQMTLSECFEQIPCKIVLLCYDKNLKEFRHHDLELERLLAEKLFPVSLSVEERTKHWILLHSLFSDAHLKAFNSMLRQKRRFRSELHVYLSYWNKEKEHASEGMTARLEATFLKMLAVFPDLLEALKCLKSLQKVKDDQIHIGLIQLLDEVAFENVKTARDNLLKQIEKIDDKPCRNNLKLLSLRCFHNIFNVEHVRCILQYISDKRDNISEDSMFNLLQVILNNFPDLLRGCEDPFQLLILEGDSSLREELVQILAKTGSFVSFRISDLYPALESFCLDGTRSQSKIAVSAIAAITGPSKHEVFTELFQKLKKSLYDGRNIPTVLQSLSCTAQHSDLAFQDQNEISSFIKERIFEGSLSSYSPSLYENSGCSFSFNIETKIYGIKTLVKLLLPKKGDEERHQLDSLVNLLFTLLQMKECTGLSVVSGSDADLIRLTAAKSILRLSARWDTHISLQTFQCTVMLAKDNLFTARRLFLDKTHKMLKKHCIPNRYACAILLASSDCMKVVRDISISYMVDFVGEFREAAAQVNQVSVSNGRNMTDYPAYIVVYLIYVLAHDGGFPSESCQDEKVFAHFCRPLYVLIHPLRNGESSLLHLLSLFRAVKRAEDAIDPQGTHKLHKLADIGSYIVRVLKPESADLSFAPCSVLLPSSLYRSSQMTTTEGSSRSPVGSSSDHGFLKRITKAIEDTFEQPSTSVSTLKCNIDAQTESISPNIRDGMYQETIDETDSFNVGMEGPKIVSESTAPYVEVQRETRSRSAGVTQSKGKALCDRTNSLTACAANSLKGKSNSGKRRRAAAGPSLVNDDANKDSIAYRTRRRKA